MIQYNDFTELPKGFQEFLTPRLYDGEMIIAAWQPNSKEYQQHQLLIQLLGAIFGFVAYVVFWGFGAPPSGIERLSFENLNLFVCFICFGFAVGATYLMLMPLWSWSWARRTLYIFTNQRALIVDSKNDFYGMRFEAFEGEPIQKAKTTKYKGKVNIVFRVHRYEEDGQTWSESRGFFGITNPELALKLLNMLKSKIDNSV